MDRIQIGAGLGFSVGSDRSRFFLLQALVKHKKIKSKQITHYFLRVESFQQTIML